jgi:hypothetical protein
MAFSVTVSFNLDVTSLVTIGFAFCSAAFRIPLDPRDVATLCGLTPAADGSSDMAAVWASVPE